MSAFEFDHRVKRMFRDNLQLAWIVPFSMVENLPTLFSGLFDVVLDAVTIGRHYLVAVRNSVVNMNEFHARYREDSDDDDDFSDTESVSGESRVSTASRMSTRSSSKKKEC
jgi:hypothetical protein